MAKKKSKWFDEQKRCGQPEASASRKNLAFFGCRRIPEDEKAKWVLKHFNTVAKKYDLMNTLLSFGIHHIWKRTAVKMMALGPGDRVLDVCGGTGDLAVLAARIVGPSGRVIVYDINRAMIDVGKHKLSGMGAGKGIEFVQGDAEKISFFDGYFDAAMVAFGIRNVTRMEQGFSEMYRVLKPGGRMMCLEFSKPTAPVFRWLYDFYSFHIMPLLGEIIAGSRQAYKHLPESIRTFALPHELTGILERIGFSSVTTCNLTNGIAVIHMATKGLSAPSSGQERT